MSSEHTDSGDLPEDDPSKQLPNDADGQENSGDTEFDENVQGAMERETTPEFEAGRSEFTNRMLDVIQYAIDNEGSYPDTISVYSSEYPLGSGEMHDTVNIPLPQKGRAPEYISITRSDVAEYGRGYKDDELPILDVNRFLASEPFEDDIGDTLAGGLVKSGIPAENTTELVGYRMKRQNIDDQRVKVFPSGRSVVSSRSYSSPRLGHREMKEAPDTELNGREVFDMMVSEVDEALAMNGVTVPPSESGTPDANAEMGGA